jgi:hypothetical protein
MIGTQLNLFSPIEIGACYVITVSSKYSYWNHKTQKATSCLSETKLFNSEKEAQKEILRLDRKLFKKHRFKVKELCDWEIEHLKELDEIERL